MTDTDRMISTTQALSLVPELLAASGIAGLRPLDREIRGDSLHIEFKRARAVSCTLSVSFGCGQRTTVRGRARRGEPDQHVWLQTARVEVCWSSTGRSVAAAHAALSLYREVVELAALIEVRLAEETIGWREEPLATADSTVAEGGSR